jgi:hypothetical protein
MQPFAGAPQFYYHSPFNMRHNCLQPTPCATKAYPSYWPPWERYDLHQGGYGNSQMVTPSSSQDMGCHLQVYRVCLQNCQETSSQLANSVQLYSSTRRYSQCNLETRIQVPNENVAPGNAITENRYHKDWRQAPIFRDF